MLGPQHRGKFDSESERKDVTYLKQWKKIQLLGIVPHYLTNLIICLQHAGLRSISAPITVSPMWKHTLYKVIKAGLTAAAGTHWYFSWLKLCSLASVPTRHLLAPQICSFHPISPLEKKKITSCKWIDIFCVLRQQLQQSTQVPLASEFDPSWFTFLNAEMGKHTLGMCKASNDFYGVFIFLSYMSYHKNIILPKIDIYKAPAIPCVILNLW